MPLSDGHLRKDAQANHVKILRVAGEMVAERGIHFSMEDIASRAGVGVGTVYRHYVCKAELVEHVYIDRAERIIERVTEQIVVADPWLGFVATMREAQTVFDEFQALVCVGIAESPAVKECQRTLMERLDIVLRRAQLVGVVRADLSVYDLPPLFSVLAAAPLNHELVPVSTRERVFHIVLAGCRPDPSPIPHEPLGPGDFSGIVRAIHDES